MKKLFEDSATAEVKAVKFHNTIIELTSERILKYAKEFDCKNVCLSGGCFQNRLLVMGLMKKLKKKVKLHINCLVPLNDGGIAFGQVVMGKFFKKD